MGARKNIRKRWTGMAKRAFRWARDICAAIGFIFVMYCLCFDLSIIVSESMEPALKGSSIDDGDWVLSEKLSFRFRDPRRWEVIACRQKDGTAVMKRVAGLPGEFVSMRKHRVLIDGSAVAHPAPVAGIKYYAYGNLHRGRVTPCVDAFFVLGDNSWDSHDSRFDGPLPRRRIRGRPVVIVWPPDRIGWVE